MAGTRSDPIEIDDPTGALLLMLARHGRDCRPPKYHLRACELTEGNVCFHHLIGECEGRCRFQKKHFFYRKDYRRHRINLILLKFAMRLYRRACAWSSLENFWIMIGICGDVIELMFVYIGHPYTRPWIDDIIDKEPEFTDDQAALIKHNQSYLHTAAMCGYLLAPLTRLN